MEQCQPWAGGPGLKQHGEQANKHRSFCALFCSAHTSVNDGLWRGSVSKVSLLLPKVLMVMEFITAIETRTEQFPAFIYLSLCPTQRTGLPTPPLLPSENTSAGQQLRTQCLRTKGDSRQGAQGLGYIVVWEQLGGVGSSHVCTLARNARDDHSSASHNNYLQRWPWKVCAELSKLDQNQTFLRAAVSYSFLLYYFLKTYLLCIQCSACTPEEDTTSHYRWLWTTMWLVGIELRTSGRTVLTLSSPS